MASRRRLPRRKGNGGDANPHFVNELCSLVNPFCDAANGARWPISGGIGSVTFQVREVITLTSGAGGYAGLVYFPGAGGEYRDTDATVATTMTIPASLPDGEAVYKALHVAGIADFRVINAGCRWWDIAASSAVGGTVIATELSSIDNVLGDAIDMTSMSYGVATMALDRRVPGIWVGKRNRITNLMSPAASAGNADGNMSGLMLSVSGPASSAILQVEIVMNIEFTFDHDHALSASTPKPRDRPAHVVELLERGRATLVKASPSFFDGMTSTFEKTIVSIAKSTAKSILRDVLNPSSILKLL
jgi:hypothetical protein